MKGNKKYPHQSHIKNHLTYHTPPTDHRKKGVKKFEWQSLRNEIDVTQVWQMILCR